MASKRSRCRAAEAARVLRPGGVYAYTAWLPPQDGWDLFDLLMAAITRHGSMDVDLPSAPPPFRFADAANAQAEFETAGFKTVSARKHVAIWTGTSDDDLLELLSKGVGRAPMMIDAQEPEARDAIREDLRAGAKAMREDGKIRMRWPHLIVTGRRAGTRSPSGADAG